MSKTNYIVLIVDDDLGFHRKFRDTLGHRFVFESAASEIRMREKINGKDHIDLILLDLVLDESKEKTGLKLIPEIRIARAGVPIIAMTGWDYENEIVVEATKAGATDFVDKNKINFEAWEAKMDSVIEANPIAIEPADLAKKVAKHQAQVSDKHAFIGESEKIIEVRRNLEAVAQVPHVTVLLTGESGVGKEVAARYLHQHSPRAHMPFVGVNLSAVNQGTLESELFGHVKGAYTDAHADKDGFFREAAGGVLLLDEIGDVPLDIQTKLLRVLEERTIRPTGMNKDVEVDVQLVTATHHDLAKEVDEKRFRLDLYQRLSTFIVEIPPLRDRKEDIPLLLRHFIKQHFPGKDLPEVFTKETLDRLMDYTWEGNIRQLRGCIDYALVRRVVFKSELITFDCLPTKIQQFDPSTVQVLNPSKDAPKTQNKKEKQAYDDLVKIEDTLRQTGIDKTKTANLLGYPGTDNMRVRIKTCYQNYPHLFDRFPIIKEEYNTIVK